MKKLIFILVLGVIIGCQPSCGDSNPSIETNTDNEKRKEENVVEYYPSGIKKLEGKLVNGERHGKWIYYYENGFIWSEGQYWYGKRKGYSLVYYENGRKKLVGQYENNLKVGVWEVWNQDGTLAQKVNIDEMETKGDALDLEDKEEIEANVDSLNVERKGERKEK